MAFLRMSVALNSRTLDLPDMFDLPKAVVGRAETEVDKRFRKHEKRLFATEGASGGTRWQALSDAYRKWKARKFPGRKILTLLGDMRDAFTKAGGDHVSRSFRTGGEWKIQVGANTEKGFWHATGAGNLPVRPPIQTTESQAEQITLGVNVALVPHVIRFLKTFGRISRASR